MAIDSALKRFSATGLLLPFRGGCLPRTAGIVAVERQVAAWIYSGIAAAEIVETPYPLLITLSEETEYSLSLSEETEYSLSLSEETEYSLSLSEEGGGIA